MIPASCIFFAVLHAIYAVYIAYNVNGSNAIITEFVVLSYVFVTSLYTGKCFCYAIFAPQITEWRFDCQVNSQYASSKGVVHSYYDNISNFKILYVK
jgi:hypothetical protein